MWGYIIFLTYGVYYPPMPYHILRMPDMADPGAMTGGKPFFLVAKQVGKVYKPGSETSRVQHTTVDTAFCQCDVNTLYVNLTESVITWELGSWAGLFRGLS